MDRAADHLAAVGPALLFLLAGVPLAALLERLGFFDAVVGVIEHRRGAVSLSALWWLSAATTAVLNLDTTIVLLTPLVVRLARRAGVDPLPVAAVPLLLASLASSVLPVSNLTTLIAAEHFDLSTADVVGRLAPVSLVVGLVGWLVHRRRHPGVLVVSPGAPVDGRALGVGGAVVGFLLVGFVLGPLWDVDPWLVALVADVALVVATRWVPWRELPLRMAAVVGAVTVVAALVVPADLLTTLLEQDGPAEVAGVALAGAVAANLLNNLPALLVALDATGTMTPGQWAWLAGLNTGAVLLPLGALANLLWWRILRQEEVAFSLRRYVAVVVPIAAPALLAGAAVLAIQQVAGW